MVLLKDTRPVWQPKVLIKKKGINYLETFSLVIKIDLDEEVCMKCPHGLNVSHKNMVGKLKKSIYGLKQANSQCNQILTSTFFYSGLNQSRPDYSLYWSKSTGVHVTPIRAEVLKGLSRYIMIYFG